eukprot:g42257.t1
MLGHFEIKKEVVFGLLKSIKVDKSLGPDGRQLSLLREVREEIAGDLIKIFVSSVATREVSGGLEVTNVIEGRVVDVVYMDFSKAFDKVPHCRLTQKIKKHGILFNLSSYVRPANPSISL